MRLPAILATLLMMAAGFAGCFGSEEEPATPAGTGGAGGNNGLPGTGGIGQTLTVLAPLKTSIATPAPAWVKAGTAVDVTATATASKMKEPITYTWATGALPGTVDVEPQTLDTGSKDSKMYIQSGESKALVFKAAGVYEMHCHPHAFMRQNITVVEGFKGPSEVHVAIVDGKSLNEYTYVPERLLIGVNTKVIYHNNGTQPHTATLMTQEPPLKLATLAEATGQVTVDGEGWQRIVVVAKDAEGRIGQAEHRIYVTSELPSFATKTFTFSFTAGGVSGVAAAPDEAEAPKSEQFSLEQPGKIFLNWTGTDAASASGETLADFELHLVKQGETQDSLTGDGPSGALSSAVPNGVYTLTVKATGGVQPEATVTIDVVYDLVPPEPAAPAADAGHGGHGGHAH